jgi:hypothetical protein
MTLRLSTGEWGLSAVEVELIHGATGLGLRSGSVEVKQMAWRWIADLLVRMLVTDFKKMPTTECPPRFAGVSQGFPRCGGRRRILRQLFRSASLITQPPSV